ncbi:MAG: beta-ketoacyl synthase chain length factor [Candidatus Methylumidiphilus sp.]
MMECMTLLGFGACAPDSEFRASMPFPAGDIDRGAMPASLRRRASQAMLMAFSAADVACKRAGRPPSGLPSVFASVAGEIQVTDRLCIELAKPDGVVSPTAFHNSVHNTTAGYWGIAHHCTRPSTALAAGQDTFAMALLEAWCQLACHGGELLLVCYDERWPAYLAPPMGAPAFASAMVLGAGSVAGGMASIGRPQPGLSTRLPDNLAALAAHQPAAAAIPLLAQVAAAGKNQEIPVSMAFGGWRVSLISYTFEVTDEEQ